MALITEVHAARGMQKAGINRKNSPSTPPRTLPTLSLRVEPPLPGRVTVTFPLRNNGQVTMAQFYCDPS